MVDHQLTRTSWRVDVTHQDPDKPPRKSRIVYDAYPADDERWAREKFAFLIRDPWVAGRISLEVSLWRIETETIYETIQETDDVSETIRHKRIVRTRAEHWVRPN